MVAEARAEGRAAIDLEFLWERTYAPIACLAQVATARGVHLVDPIEGAPLRPIADLVADPAVETVMHAPSADLTLLGLAFGTRPQNLVDAQIVAGFVGLGAGQGLATLLDRVLGVTLDKGERYTDWSRRPLSDAQLEYGAADVAHLLQLADELARRAEALGRAEWVAEEHARRYGPDARLVPDPDSAWRRVKGGGRLNARDRAVLPVLAAWREREAARRDKPSAWIVPDRTLVEIARRRPKPTAAPSRTSAACPTASAAPTPTACSPPCAPARPRRRSPCPRPHHPSCSTASTCSRPLGAVLVAARAAAVNLAPSLLATRDEIAAFLLGALRGDADGAALGSGWRRELAGEALIDLAEGRLALGVDATPSLPGRDPAVRSAEGSG